jgi:outer membrane protein assembly factor BamA
MRLYTAICALFIVGLPGLAQETTADAGKQLVKIHAIRVKGSRLQDKSIQHLTGLQVGQIIDEAKVRAALQHANDSGLFSNIAYVYESLPDSTDVILELQIVDQLPLVPATIKIPKIDAEQVWQYLQNFDPLFTRELPQTEKSINLYAHYIAKFLETQNRTDVGVTGNVLGSTERATGVEFVATKLRSLPH